MNPPYTGMRLKFICQKPSHFFILLFVVVKKRENHEPPLHPDALISSDSILFETYTFLLRLEFI